MRLTRVRVSLVSGFWIIFVLIVYLSGLAEYIKQSSFDKDFYYPLNVNIKPLVEKYRHNETLDIAPINFYDFNYVTHISAKCSGENNYLVIIVKSYVYNFERRLAIRSTWGLEHRFNEAVQVRTVFIVGAKIKSDIFMDNKLKTEIKEYNDIVQTDAVEHYYNNTIKTMLGFRWAYKYCNKAKYYLFSDDDMYISIKNVFKLIKDYESMVNKPPMLYAGFVFHSSPQRHLTSKWYVDLEEYPFDRWPTYVTAGMYILSNEALQNLYVGSLFVKHFRFDDIYLGIVSKKLGLVPLHSDNIFFYHKRYSLKGFCDVIASHGYDQPSQLVKVWSEQMLFGCA